MWYVIQTIAGNEEKLASRINIMLSKSLYTECFVIRSERLKRLGEEWRIQALPLFPGYVFIDTGKPEDIFFRAKGHTKGCAAFGKREVCVYGCGGLGTAFPGNDLRSRDAGQGGE